MPHTPKFYPFSDVPVSDSCWSLSTGPDGRIYIAVCSEGLGGVSVYIARYNDETDRLDYLVDASKETNDPPDSGRATQCKIHYCFCPSRHDGILYAATHLSGPALGDFLYSPWADWNDPRKAFRGSALMAFDTKTDAVLWWDTIAPREGARCMALDEERGKLYCITYPRDHFVVYDITTRSRRDLGRIGAINSQIVFTDRKGRAYTSSDMGQLVRYDPDRDRLEEIPAYLPCEPYQSRWHSVFYDAVASPEGDCIYGVTWREHMHLFRYWPEEGEFGRMEDFGPVTQERDHSYPADTFSDHAGGLVFGADGMLYFVHSRWPEKSSFPTPEGAVGVVCQVNPQTMEKKDFAYLKEEGRPSQYVSRAGRDRFGNLYFGHVGGTPSGMFRLPMDNPSGRSDLHEPLRTWG
ncbi:MAG TPA: hypothetical protein P5569_07515 [Candidatus Latescibacteria bacterium]|nr:hypothetical protein [Candidatus Latescibacterota bacterium]